MQYQHNTQTYDIILLLLLSFKYDDDYDYYSNYTDLFTVVRAGFNLFSGIIELCHAFSRHRLGQQMLLTTHKTFYQPFT